MKKFVLFSAGLLLLAVSTQAQVAFGVKAGFNAATILYDENDGNRVLPAWHAGFMADIPVTRAFSIRPELLASVKGGKNKYQADVLGDGHIYNVTERLRLTYLELPVNFLFAPQVGRGRLFVGGGPYVGLGLSAKARMSFDPALNGMLEYVDLKAKFDGKETSPDSTDAVAVHLRRFDAGLNFTAGYELPIGLMFSLNSSVGLVNIDPGGEQSKNIYVGISVGYLLRRK